MIILFIEKKMVIVRDNWIGKNKLKMMIVILSLCVWLDLYFCM